MSFEKPQNVLIIKYILAVKNIFPLDFVKYLSYSEAQKNRNVINMWKRFQEAGVLF